MRLLNSLLLLTLISCAIPSWASNDSRILVLGDSISAGYGVAENEHWVSLLTQKIKSHTIINASVSGETTSGGLSRLPLLLKQHQPTLVIIELGGNDGLRGQSPMMIKKNLSAMIKLAKSAKAKVLLSGIILPPNYGLAYTEQFKKVFRDVQKENSIALLPDILLNVGENKKLMQGDGVHPNAEGHQIIITTVFAYLKPLL